MEEEKLYKYIRETIKKQDFNNIHTFNRLIKHGITSSKTNAGFHTFSVLTYLLLSFKNSKYLLYFLQVSLVDHFYYNLSFLPLSLLLSNKFH